MFHGTNTLDDNFRIVHSFHAYEIFLESEKLNHLRGKRQQMIENYDYDKFVTIVIADVDVELKVVTCLLLES